MRIEFTLPGLPKRTNNNGGHWRAKQAEATKWKTRVVNHLRLTKQVPSSPLPYAKLTLIRYSSARPDYDGLVSGFKHVIDGLIIAGVIINDSPENIGVPIYAWRKEAKRNGYIKVIIEESCLNALQTQTYDKEIDL